MHSKELIEKVKQKFGQCKCLSETAQIFDLALSTVEYMVRNNYDKTKKKRGPKPVLSPRENLQIKREVKRLKGGQEKITAKKIKENLNLTCHAKTVQRQLRKMNMRYKNNAKKIILTREHKENRLRLAHQWISTSHDWSSTVFSDEKKFNLDGPDLRISRMEDNKELRRSSRQMGGGSVMVWAMLMPHGEIAVYRVIGRINSQYYTEFLEQKPSPLLFNRFGRQKFTFQQDNARIHVSKHSMSWLETHFPAVLEWPARSPDLNPVENVWKMLSDIVYDGPSYPGQEELMESIENAARLLNETRSNDLRSLVAGMNGRLLKVIIKKGAIIN